LNKIIIISIEKVNHVDNIVNRDYFLSMAVIDKKIFIFHIRKADNSGLYLHPFENFEKMISKGSSLLVEGKYGEEPVIESLTSFRNNLYRIVENSVNNWIAESRFIPRFLSSALVFLIVYFVLSFVVRDPLPMLDEIAAGLVGSVVFYFAMGKKYKRSAPASRLRGHYRGVVDRIVFQESEFVKTVEFIIGQMKNKSIEDNLIIMRSDFPEKNIIFSEQFADERFQLISYIEGELRRTQSKKQKKIISRIIADHDINSLNRIKELNLLELNGEIDIILFLIYLRLKIS
jgi:hypothetical protein